MHITFFFRHPRPEYNSIEEVFETILQSFPNTVTFDRVMLPYSGAGIKAIVGNLLYARRRRGEINHITGDVHYVAIATGSHSVLTIHDVHSILHGSVLRRFFIKVLWFWLPALCVKRITVISPKSAEEVGEVVPFFRRKIRVVPNPFNPKIGSGHTSVVSGQWSVVSGKGEVCSRQLAVGSGSFGEASADEGGKVVILLVGTKANKNFARTVEALDAGRVRLIVLGKLSDAQREQLDGRGFEYELFFNIPYAEVAELYRRADLVCFASTYEGFGMPILEAQLADRPIVTSNIDPMKWVAGEGACLVEPYNIDDIRRGVTRLMDDHHYREEVVRKGRENVSRFDPGVIAGMYCRVYGEVGGGE